MAEQTPPLDDEKILACVDRSRFADCVADYAAWAARRIGAPLEFLHILDRHPERGSGEDHSGAIGIDAQATLLSELADKDEARSREARDAGRVFLARLLREGLLEFAMALAHVHLGRAGGAGAFAPA
ncbi:MAG: universal stress protein, partial [Pseudomonadales bacterium]|nr:universal stress protein [Pseudomonadales bacterium]